MKLWLQILGTIINRQNMVMSKIWNYDWFEMEAFSVV